MTLAAVPDVTPDELLIKPVVVHLSRDLGGAQILFRVYADGKPPVVDVRWSDRDAWVPAALADVEVEVRAS